MNQKDIENGAASSPLERLVMREGYCCDCESNPETSLPAAAKTEGNPCNGCWFNDNKPNWKSKCGKQYYTDDGMLMNSDGTRSIFDDVNA